MKKHKLFIDYDNSITNSTKAIVDLYNEDFKYYKKYEYVHWTDIRSWDFLECNCAKPEYINTYFNQQRFFDRVEFMDNAEEVLKRLSKRYEIIIVSLGFSPNLRAKEYWIKEHIPYVKFIGVNMKKYKNKNHIDMSDGLLYIDDKSSNLNTNAKHQVCFGDIYDWNENWKGNRCFNWYEVEKYLEELEKGVSK